MEWVETTGRTIEEAKRAALDQLGVDESDADFEIVAEPKIGLFGRVKEEARVRARVQPRYPRPKGDRRDRRRGRSAGAGTSAESAGTAPAPAGPARAGRTAASRKSGGSTATAVGAPADGAAGSEPDDGEAAGPKPARRRRSSSSASQARVASAAGESGSVGEMTTVSVQEQAEAAEQFLRGLLQEMGASATITSSAEDGSIDVQVTGEDLGTLIGPKGATLVALQELTRTILQRKGSPLEARVNVDVNGYRKRRTEALARFAREQASEVAATGTKRALEPMSSADRKVVHDAITGTPGVTTLSEGEEPNRRVVILPAGAAAQQDPGDAADGE